MKKELAERPCIVCKGEFKAKRDDARFCSPNCRQKFARNPNSYIIDEALKSKIEYKAPDEKAYDAPPLKELINDEPSKFAKILKESESAPKKKNIFDGLIFQVPEKALSKTEQLRKLRGG